VEEEEEEEEEEEKRMPREWRGSRFTWTGRVSGMQSLHYVYRWPTTWRS
jgi:hypothetical protein